MKKTTKYYLDYNGLRKTKIDFINFNFGDNRQCGEFIVFKDIERVKEYMKENGFIFNFQLRDDMFFKYKNKVYGFKIKGIIY